jgi:hypothetical protein
MSAGRSVGDVGNNVGGSMVMSVDDRTKCESGPILIRM